ncbi:hypothetical protein V2A60_008531 [Cordyceps javanica]
MSKGLTLARLFHEKGHTVVGADVDPFACGRASRAVNKFYTLPAPPTNPGPSTSSGGQTSPYVDALVGIVKAEDIDLWVSVSGVSSALLDSSAKAAIEKCTRARAIQFSLHDVEALDGKDTFSELTRHLGLRTPESKTVRSKDELVAFLNDHGGLAQERGLSQYLIKPIGVNDAARLEMPLLPLPRESETRLRIDLLDFENVSSFIAQEFISGEEYCTYSLVVHGQVRAFVACKSSEVLVHYVALPAASVLSEAMLRFTRAVAESRGPDFTGQLAFDFIVKPPEKDSGNLLGQLYPIECNPRTHTAVVLFRSTPELVDEYLSALGPAESTKARPLYPKHLQRHYWLGQDLVEMVLCPFYHALSNSAGASTLVFTVQDLDENRPQV